MATAEEALDAGDWPRLGVLLDENHTLVRYNAFTNHWPFVIVLGRRYFHIEHVACMSVGLLSALALSWQQY